MKITKNELKTLIRRHFINEGLLDSITGAISGAGEGLKNLLTRGAVKSTMVQNSSEDAYNLFNAMQGLGTTEKVIEDIFIVRSTQNTLVELYDEYNKLLNFFNEDFWGKYASLGGPLRAMDWDGDLITWLEGDGMDAEAKQVKVALAQAKRKRQLVDITFAGM